MGPVDFDIVVVGSGHGACEAGLASARLGMKTVIVSMDISNIAGMPCNPAIGGPGKAQIVAEIDALGGEMALAADSCAVEVRMLNASKGPAVRSLRAQIDKHRYSRYMRKQIQDAGIPLVEAMVTGIIVDGSAVSGVILDDGSEIHSRAVILCTGVYLDSRIVIGEEIFDSGPIGEKRAEGLSDWLKSHGFNLGRFKTGTSPRIHKDSIDWAQLVPEKGLEKPAAFSFMSVPRTWDNQACYSAYTTPAVHEVIKENIEKAPLFDGTIQGVGPRYCPSIEDKIMRFPHRQRHQIYFEIESKDSPDVYLLGLSTSLPKGVQYKMVRAMPGLEKAIITRPGYAIEYDYIVPSQIQPTFEIQGISGLYVAGQINGSSGYEEAAAQGLLAAINAAMKINGSEPLILGRQEAYIGVLLDDLVSTSIEEPYRMLTSRAEYRLLLRHTNADMRLTREGRRVGLVSDDRWEAFERKERFVVKGRSLLGRRVAGGIVKDLLRLPGNEIEDFFVSLEGLGSLPHDVLGEIEIEAKYAGFIERQEREAKRLERYLGRRLPMAMDWSKVSSLSRETIDKLSRFRPATLGRAIDAGVSPSDALVILALLRGRKLTGAGASAENGGRLSSVST